MSKKYSEVMYMAACAQPDQCVVWTGRTNAGGYVVLGRDGKHVYAHREVCRQYHGEAPGDCMDAAHSCGVRACINPHHLRWATRSENHRDRRGHGTAANYSKLGVEKVSAIRQRLSQGESQKAIAAELGVHPTTIHYLAAGKTWTWVS